MGSDLSSTESLSAVYSTNLGAHPGRLRPDLHFPWRTRMARKAATSGSVMAIFRRPTYCTWSRVTITGVHRKQPTRDLLSARHGPTLTLKRVMPRMGQHLRDPGGGTTLINSSATIFDYFINKIGDADLWLSTNADSGSSWTAGGTNTTNLYTGASFFIPALPQYSRLARAMPSILADNGVAQYACTNINWTTRMLSVELILNWYSDQILLKRPPPTRAPVAFLAGQFLLSHCGGQNNNTFSWLLFTLQAHFRA